uniref:N-acetyltransferase domain-containing protein n=1 Tax=Heterorhabditis bacteriophora TaxID=37862 RepID=A0A1I7WSJ6_HETBA
MVTVWWSASGVIHYNFLDPGETITGEKYCQEIDKIHQKQQRLRPVLPYSAYSPDLSPTDYHFLKHFDNFLQERVLSNLTATKNTVEEFIGFKTPKFYATRINRLGLGGSSLETEQSIDYFVRDSLRYPYTRVAYYKDRPIGFSLITVRHRNAAFNRLEILGPKPDRTPNFSLLCDIYDHCEQEFWKVTPSVHRVWMVVAVFVEPEFRRKGIGSTMVSTQHSVFNKLNKE